jgi:hypothetical protein
MPRDRTFISSISSLALGGAHGEQSMPTTSRRQFLTALSTAAAALMLPRERALAYVATRRRADIPHPAPRPGITAANIVPREMLNAPAKVLDTFDAVRAIPQIVDGIRCNCGCAGQPNYYSLLTCYEGKSAMALSCGVCQAQGTLAARLHAEGKTLDEIRSAVDAKFG